MNTRMGISVTRVLLVVCAAVALARGRERSSSERSEELSEEEERRVGRLCLAPPQDVYSGTLRNDLGVPVEITVTYRDFRGRVQYVKAYVPGLGSHFFQQITTPEGPCTFTKVIQTVVATVPDSGVTLEADEPFKGVLRPTKNYTWTVSGTPDHPVLEEGAS